MSSGKTSTDSREINPFAKHAEIIKTVASAAASVITKGKELYAESSRLSDDYKNQSDYFLEDKSNNGSTLEGMVARGVLSQRAEERNRTRLATRTVSTKPELEDASNAGFREITVIGDLANNLLKAKKLAYVGAGTIALLTAALTAIPFTGGLSMVGAASIATLTGLEIAAIIAAASIGVTLIIAIFKDYEEIECSPGRLVLKKQSP